MPPCLALCEGHLEEHFILEGETVLYVLVSVDICSLHTDVGASMPVSVEATG